MKEANEQKRGAGIELRVALNAMLRRNALARPNESALLDPVDRARFTDGAPRRLSYAETEAAVARLAKQLKNFNLGPAAVVAIQLPNIIEAVIALLAVERAGLVAAPVPMAWRRSDLARALREVMPAAIITLARLGEGRPATVVCEAAAELFSLSFPCSFGEDLPDGAIPLTLDTGGADSSSLPAVAPNEQISIVTFDASAAGPRAVGRTQAEWLAAGLAVLVEGGIQSGARLVTTISLSSLAGISGALVPWLLSGGSLQLVHGNIPTFDRAVLTGTHLVAPAVAIAALASERPVGLASIIAVQRGRAAEFDGSGADVIVDLHVLGEVAAIPLRRQDPARTAVLPLGRVPLSAPVEIETRIEPDGTLALRGASLAHASLSGSAPASPVLSGETFVPTHHPCRDQDGGLAIEGLPAGVVAVGGLRFGWDDLCTRIAEAVPDADVRRAEDPLLGGRLMIETADPVAAVAALEAAGLPEVVLEAVTARAVRALAS